jgi:hypothetical protein
VQPPISIFRCRALASPKASPRAIPWDVVHRRMPLIDRPRIRLMPNATGLRDVGMEDSDRWVLGVVVKFHPDLTTVVWLDNDQPQPRLYQRSSRRAGVGSAQSWGPRNQM